MVAMWDDRERLLSGAQVWIADVPDGGRACQLRALISVIHETAVDLQKLPVVGMTVTDPSDHGSKNISRPT